MAYNPRDHMIKLPGRKGGPPIDYLPVKERVHWLREEHPNAHITTQVIELTDSRCVMLATVSIPEGGSASAIGSEVKAVFPDYVEKADTVALGRALAILGFGIDFSDEFEESKDQADPRDYKSIEPPQEQPKAHAKAEGWPENAKPKPTAQQVSEMAAPPTAKQPTIPADPAPQVMLDNLANLAIQKGVHLGEWCTEQVGKLPGQLTTREAARLYNELKRQVM